MDRFLAIYLEMFVIIALAMVGALVIGMVGTHDALQNQAQYLAVSQAKYGGYTTEADKSLDEFIEDVGLKRDRLEVEVSAPNHPVPWGTPVYAKVKYYYGFEVGDIVITLPQPLVAEGRAVSTYMPNTYNVVYTSPHV